MPKFVWNLTSFIYVFVGSHHYNLQAYEWECPLFDLKTMWLLVFKSRHAPKRMQLLENVPCLLICAGLHPAPCRYLTATSPLLYVTPAPRGWGWKSQPAEAHSVSRHISVWWKVASAGPGTQLNPRLKAAALEKWRRIKRKLTGGREEAFCQEMR